MLGHSPNLDLERPRVAPKPRRRRVLNVGAGSASAGRLHVGFRPAAWEQTRLDIDPLTDPDLLGSITSLHEVADEGSFDAVWCSHVLEHMPSHDVPTALKECRRVLNPTGFAIITTPDLSAVARQVLAHSLDAVAYHSPAGPITALDMLYGHGASVAAGHVYMSHRTGFTVDRLGRLAADAGFAEARVAEGASYDLWAVLTLPKTDVAAVRASFAKTNIGRLFD